MSKSWFTVEELDQKLAAIDEWNAAHPIRSRIELIPYRVKSFRPIWKTRMFIERGRKGYNVEDAWNLDHHIARVIGGGTRILLRENHGYPGELTPEQWKAKLEKIANTFEKYDREYDEWGSEQLRATGVWDDLAKWFGALWD